jgi:hypothetical protein
VEVDMMPVATEARLLFLAALVVLAVTALGLAWVASLWKAARRAAVEPRPRALPGCTP